MPVRIPAASLAAIEEVVAQRPDGASFGDVAEALPERLADRTLQYRLKYLVNKGRLIKKRRGAAVDPVSRAGSGTSGGGQANDGSGRCCTSGDRRNGVFPQES